MKKIYCLSIDGNVFYIGQTKQKLYMRLQGHFSSNPDIKIMPLWIHQLIKISELEVCKIANANSRERYWIKYYKAQGNKLINKNHYSTKEYKPKHLYVRLTNEQTAFIRKNGYSQIAYKLGIDPETLRVAIVKNRVKKAYFEKIFPLQLNNNELLTIYRHNNTKINLD